LVPSRVEAGGSCGAGQSLARFRAGRPWGGTRQRDWHAIRSRRGIAGIASPAKGLFYRPRIQVDAKTATRAANLSGHKICRFCNLYSPKLSGRSGATFSIRRFVDRFGTPLAMQFPRLGPREFQSSSHQAASELRSGRTNTIHGTRRCHWKTAFTIDLKAARAFPNLPDRRGNGTLLMLVGLRLARQILAVTRTLHGS
jgi:hypothetical protein